MPSSRPSSANARLLLGAERVVADDLGGLLERLGRADHRRAACPVGDGVRQLRRSRSRCAAAARAGRCRSRARAASTICSRATVSNIHGPRYAPRPHVFVHTDRVRSDADRALVRTGEQQRRRAGRRRRSRRPGTRRRPRGGRCTRRGGGRRRRARTCTCATSSRAWFDAMRFSRRSSIHFNGAAEATRGQRDDELLARSEELLPEAAADVARTSTRTRCVGHAGDPRRSRARASCGFCVRHPRVQLAARSGSYSATMPRVSIGTGVWRCWRNVSRDHVRRRASSASQLGRDAGTAISAPRFVPSSGCTTARRRRAACLEVDDGRLDARCRPRRARPRPRRRSGSRRRSSTIGSPTNRTSPSASGRSGAPGIAEQHRRLHRARVRVEVGRREHRDHAVERAGRVDVDAHDAARARRRCARTLQCSMPGQHDVVDVAAVPGEQARVLAALHRLADEPARGRRASCRTAAPAPPRAAPRAMMPW